MLAAAVAAALVGCSSPEASPPDGSEVDLGAPSTDEGTDDEDPDVGTDDPEPEPESSATLVPFEDPVFEEFALPPGTRPHDVAPAPDGRVWFTAQRTGDLGVLDPATGEVELVPLGAGAAPHGVIVGPDGRPWITDGGLNAIVVVDPGSYEVTTYELPRPDAANLNTASFDRDGILWFTGQAGVHGYLDPTSEAVVVIDSPRGRGPYGIATTPDGDVWFSSLAGSYIAEIVSGDGDLDVVDVPSPDGGARRVWSDSNGVLWVTEWSAGNLARYDPAMARWLTWRLPGDDPQPYAVYVDEFDHVWVTDFGADTLVRFDPATEEFRSFPWPTAGAQVRQLLGRPGEVWGAGSGTDTLIVLRTAG